MALEQVPAILDELGLRDIPHKAHDLLSSLYTIELFPYFVAVHATTVCVRLRPPLRNQFWLLSLVLSTIACVAGPTVRSLLLAEPAPWWKSNTWIPLNMLVWYLINWSPFDIVWNIYNLPPVKILFNVLRYVTSTRSIFAAMEAAATRFPNSFVAVIIFGTLGGASANIFFYIADRINDPNAQSELSNPTWAIKAPFWASVFVCLFSDPLHQQTGPLLDLHTAFMVVVTYLFCHALIAQTFGMFTPPPISQLESVFYFLTRLPRKPLQATAVKPTDTGLSKKPTPSIIEVPSSPVTSSSSATAATATVKEMKKRKKAAKSQ